MNRYGNRPKRQPDGMQFAGKTTEWIKNFKKHKNDQTDKKSEFSKQRLKLTTKKAHTQADKRPDKTLRQAIGKETQTGKGKEAHNRSLQLLKSQTKINKL